MPAEADQLSTADPRPEAETPALVSYSPDEKEAHRMTRTAAELVATESEAIGYLKTLGWIRDDSGTWCSGDGLVRGTAIAIQTLRLIILELRK
jgi:hypothetical protein